MPSSIMTSKMTSKQQPGSRRAIPLTQQLGRRIVFAMLSKLAAGRLILSEEGRTHRFGHDHNMDGPEARVTIVDPQFYQAAAFGGSIGVAESFMAGHWRSDDLVAMVRLIIRNQQVFRGLDKGWSRLANLLNSGLHWLRKNTQRGSRTNIVAHYDLGNRFYRLFLDRTMAYSCGIFESSHTTLRAASIAKFDRICKKLELNADDHLLEIGTGWGGFAIYAASHHGCRVTTTTISDRQFAYARQKVREAGLAERITVLKQDYRTLTGRFDKLVSIEMIEAVGHQFLDTYFQTCSHRLKPDGMMLLQAITINDQSYDRHKRSSDFIKRHIFPGSCLTSVTAMSRALSRHTDMRIFHLEDITPHYATTLNRWRKRFYKNMDTVRQLGFEDAFIRMWLYYLCYCEAGFLERYIGNVQILMTKPENRRSSLLSI